MSAIVDVGFSIVLVESGYISVRRLKALKVLNMVRELPIDYTQEEIEQNLNILKFKLKMITIPFEDFLCFKTNKLLCLASYNRSSHKSL
ncbi:11233_t:CDS:2 [Funneliformis geosporum]|nr:11233_t:CDS:2 [Funneliformis geosporum]